MKISEKEKLREFLKEKRKLISQERRLEVEKRILEELYPRLVDYKYILSFASFGDEINLWPLNIILCQEKKLLLSHVKHSCLDIYHIYDLKELVRSKFGILEPDPKKSIPFNKKDLICILTPGLGFDSFNHRLGYGKGHFDKLLAEFKSCTTVGIGFKEQFVKEPLPIEQHDRKLDDVMLF